MCTSTGQILLPKIKTIVFTFLMLVNVLLNPDIQAQLVKTGLEVLRADGFSILKGKRIGLITNPTGVDSALISTIDILYKAKGINLVALFGPEHGVRGEYAAGEDVDKYIDPKTKLPVFSIYGDVMKPTPEMLKGIDVLVYDIQDIGSRSYTYISSLGLAMEAAAENHIGFVVLDRPNPLGGIKTEGPLVEKAFTSFVSQYPIPYVYGLTVGELAMFLNGQRLLGKKAKCNLTVVPMKGWKREMSFEKTGLPWVPSSPHIPHVHSPSFYPMSGILGELYVISIGVGYTLPFQLFAAEWINADSLAANMNALKLPGLLFRPIHFKPYYGISKGLMIHGIQVHITDFEKATLSLVQFYVLQECHRLRPDKNVFELSDQQKISMFDKVCGTDKIRLEFTKSFSASAVEKIWMNGTQAFHEKAKKYFLY
jgi:uncharacterized protein YbbC (DUF1343 family)